jgi:hypothetical protein
MRHCLQSIGAKTRAPIATRLNPRILQDVDSSSMSSLRFTKKIRQGGKRMRGGNQSLSDRERTP